MNTTESDSRSVPVRAHLSTVLHAVSFRVWKFLVAVMPIGRMVWYFELRDRFPGSVGAPGWIAVFVSGSRQGSSAAGYLRLPAFVCGMIVSLLPRLDPVATGIRAISMTSALVVAHFLFFRIVGYCRPFADAFKATTFVVPEGNASLVFVKVVRDHGLFKRLLVMARGAVITNVVYRFSCRRNGVSRFEQVLKGDSWRCRICAAVAIQSVSHL